MSLTPTQIYSLLALIIYLLLIGWIAYKSSKRETAEQFAIGGRNVGLLGTVASLASGFRDGAGLAVWVSLAYFFGFGAMWLAIGLAGGLGALALKAHIVRERAVQGGFVTVGDLLRSKVGPYTAQISSLIIAGTALLYSAAQVFVSGRIFAEILSLPINAGILLTALVVAAYLVAGGYQTVIRTDVLQLGLIMAILVLPFFIGGSIQGSNLFESLLSPGWRTGVGFFGISFLVVYSSADVWQRIFSARSSSVARNALLTTIPIYFVIAIGLILLGFASRGVLVGVEPQDAFFELFTSTAAPAMVVAVLGVFAAASVMSTLDTQVFLFASTIAKDLLPKRESEAGTRFVRASRIVVIVLLGVLTLIATTIGDIIQFLFSAVTLGTVLAPILFIYTFWKTKKSDGVDKAITATLAIATVVYIVMFVRGDFADVLLTLVPAAVCLILCIAVFAYEGLKAKPTLHG